MIFVPGLYTNLGALLSGTWDDLRFPSTAINPPGGASDPSRSTTTGLLEFSATQDNVIAGSGQFPHEWYAGTQVRPHLHVQFITSNPDAVSRWKIEYDRANAYGDWESVYGSYAHTETVSVVNPANTRQCYIIRWSLVDMTGYKESASIRWRISRLAASDPLDTDSSVVVLDEFDIHYQKNKSGTVNEMPD